MEANLYSFNSEEPVAIVRAGFCGAISGLCEQGYVFATSRFTTEAINAQRRPDAVPVVLFDGPKIVDVMFDRGFGVAFRELRIPELALDTILEEA